MYRRMLVRIGKVALCMTTAVACSSGTDNQGTSAASAGGGSAFPVSGFGGVSGASSTVRASGGTGVSNVAGAPETGSGGATSSAGGGGPTGTGGAGAPSIDAGAGDAGDASVLPTADGGSYTGPKTNYPGRRWTVPAETYGTVIVSDVKVTMSDGIVLVGDIAYPTDLASGARAKGDFPVLLTQNPYGSVYEASSGEFFVKHGYIYASVDVRGTSRSAGTYDLFGPREAQDGAELVTWASKLDGSNGKVGLHGCSQLGINQIETATLLAPSSPVKAMIPACASGDFYRDTAFDNGIATAVGSLTAGSDMQTGGDETYYRDYWKQRDRLARAPAIAKADIPMLLWAGWHEPGTIGSLELYTALQNLAAGRPQSAQIKDGDTVNGKYQVILGDWGHAGGLDYGIQLEWYDTWIKGVDTGLPTGTKTPLHLAELGGTKRWVNAHNYPLVDAYTPFYLSSSGKLGRAAESAAGKDALTWGPDGWPGGSIEYQTVPFVDGAMLAGPVAARLQLSSSNTNAQLSVDIYDRAPDGTRIKITHGDVLGSLRRTLTQATGPETSWTDKNGLPARPYLTLDLDQPLTAGQTTELDVPLWPSVWSIEPGHTIVVRIATTPPAGDCGALLALPVGCTPTDPQRTSLTGGVYELSRGGASSSLISLPLLEHGALTTAQALVSATGIAGTPLPVDW